MSSPRQHRDVPEFFPAVMAGLQFENARSDGLRQLSDGQWHELLAFCDLAHLTLPLVSKCRDAAPPWVLSRVEQNLADNRERGQRISNAYREIATAFAAAGVDHVVIKGFTQYPLFASSLDERMQSDIDLFCPGQSLAAAQKVLEDLGYAGDLGLAKYPSDHLPEMTRRRGWQWRGNLYDPEMPPAVDMHYCFWNDALTRLAVEGADAFWDRRHIRTETDLHFPALCTIDQLAYSALHILRDLLRGDWVVHHVYEMAYFLHNQAENGVLWQAWSRGHDDALRSLQAISFSLACEWFQCQCPPVVDAEIEGLPSPVRQWLMRFSQSPLTGMFAPNKYGVWLHVSLLTATGDKLRILRNTLLPFRLPSVGLPAQNATKTRRMRTIWPSQRHVRYLLHVVFRSVFHLKLLPETFWRGLGWWLAT